MATKKFPSELNSRGTVLTTDKLLIHNISTGATEYTTVGDLLAGVSAALDLLAPIANPVFTGTVTMPLFSMGTGIDAIKALLYSYGNDRYGFGIQTNEFRQFFPTGGHLSIGTISATDGSTWSEKIRIAENGSIDLYAAGMATPSGFGHGLFPQTSVGLGLYSYAGKMGFWTGSIPVEGMRLDGSNLSVVGALSKGSGSFNIEHPLESKKSTHRLVHSFIEGPNADLIYRGKVNLIKGRATVNIDEVSRMSEGTFDMLCREVQCFTTNESGWDAVRGSVSGNILTIISQNIKSTDNISWMVIGERKDKHMMDTSWTDESGKVIVEPEIVKEVNAVNETLENK